MTPEEKKMILDELGGLPEDIYDSLVKKFLESIMGYIVQLQQSLEKNDFDSIKRIGHTIKGSGANLRLQNLSVIGKSIEESGVQKAEGLVIEGKIKALKEEITRLGNCFGLA